MAAIFVLIWKSISKPEPTVGNKPFKCPILIGVGLALAQGGILSMELAVVHVVEEDVWLARNRFWSGYPLEVVAVTRSIDLDLATLV